MDRTLTYTIEKEDDGLRVELFLRRRGFSRQNLVEIKRMPKSIMVNDVHYYMKQQLKEGDRLEVRIHETESSEKIPAVELPLDIVYEDEDIMVINKPADMPIHPSMNNYYNSLANALAYYFEQQQKPFIFRCSNRLDRDTSGLTLISKHLVSASILAEQVANREVHREYLAISRGSVTPKEGTIDAPLGRKDSSIIERWVDYEHGERAVTHYKVVRESNGHSLVSLKLETGRTHQIRIHMKHIGFPLVGDYLYNPDIEWIERQALHSHKMAFRHPITGEMMEFTAPLPEDMQRVLEGIKKMNEYRLDDAVETCTQKFAYEVVNGAVTIWRCYSRTEIAEIPKMIAGYPVTRLAPYAFSEHMNEQELKGKCYTGTEEVPALCGNRLLEVRIPETVTGVGRYCFYDCKELRRLTFTDALKDWGSGIFTGCRSMEHLTIRIYGDGRSTLKEVLTELSEVMTVDYHLVSDEGEQFARLVFPQFYEEGTENTPARLLGNRMHGSGMHYRNCFQQRTLKFQEYDSLFKYAGFHESFAVIASMAENRLRYPMELSEQARAQYETFMIEKKEAFSDYIIEKKDMDSVIWYTDMLTKLLADDKEKLNQLLGQMTEAASLAGFYEALSYLMDSWHRQGRKKVRKSFDL